MVAREVTNCWGRIGLVIPKSFSYSNSWDQVRANIGPLLSDAINVSQAWGNVLLEQLLVTYRREHSRKKHSTPLRLGRMLCTGEVVAAGRPSKIVNELSIIPTGVLQNDLECLEQISECAASRFSDFCTTRRGTGLQKWLNSFPGIAVLAGKDIADFQLREPSRFVEQSIQETAPLRFTNPPQAVFQNIVAHITRPSDHIRLLGAVATQQYACLDTVNLLRSDHLSAWALTGYLSSNLINWFVYVCVFNRAVRTMHFDGYVLRKIPFSDKLRIRDLGSSGAAFVR